MAQGMIMRRGGAAGGLNYRVYAVAAAPVAAGRENDIAIVTETAIGDVQINCGAIPTTRSDGTAVQAGDVCMLAAPKTEVPFNAVKENALYVLPGICYQYDGENWLSRAAYVYQNEWVQFAAEDDSLYREGFEGVSWGTWFEKTSSSCDAEKLATYMRLYGGASGDVAAVRTTELVDFTGIATLKVNYSEFNGSCTIFINDTLVSPFGGTVAARFDSGHAIGECSYNVASVNGLHYIQIQTNSGGSKCITRVWME